MLGVVFFGERWGEDYLVGWIEGHLSLSLGGEKPPRRCFYFTQPSISAPINGSCGGVVAES